MIAPKAVGGGARSLFRPFKVCGHHRSKGSLLAALVVLSGAFSCFLMWNSKLEGTGTIFKFWRLGQVFEWPRSQDNGGATATSGKLFTGDIIRAFPTRNIKFPPERYQGTRCQEHDRRLPRTLDCTKWGVVTTVFEPPSEALRRFAYRKEWCVVIVGDSGKPKVRTLNGTSDWEIAAILPESICAEFCNAYRLIDLFTGQNFKWNTTLGDNLVFLSDRDQMGIAAGSPFVQRLPWNSFSRKNVGYLYALAHGATVIFDFDDDNMLKFWIKDSSTDPSMDIDNFGPQGPLVDSIKIYEPTLAEDDTVFNPYPMLGAPSEDMWPRGLPLDQIRSRSNRGNKTDYQLTSTNSEVKPGHDGGDIGEGGHGQFAVLQSLADLQPDVDAIFRMTRTTPVWFERPPSIPAPSYARREGGGDTSAAPRRLIRVPEGVMTPYNAQATMVFPSGYWSLFLPTTVPGRVSDIWRSYFAQAMFRAAAPTLRLGFLPRPLVVQARNPHSYLADFEAELQLYLKSGPLVRNLLRRWKPPRDDDAGTFESQFEALYIDMYERGFIDIEDVYLVQLWIQELFDLGYRFPSPSGGSGGLCGRPDEGGGSANQSAQRFLRLKGQPLGSQFYDDYEGDHRICPELEGASLSLVTTDVHAGPRTDISSILLWLNQTVVQLGPWSLETSSNPLNESSFGGRLLPGSRLRMSPVLREYLDPRQPLPMDGVRRNYDFYQKDPLVSTADAFVCTYPASLCQLWMPFRRKSALILMPSHRYNLGRSCSRRSWVAWNADVKTLLSQGPDRHSVGAVSRYDLEYIKYYIPEAGPSLILAPSYAGFYTPDQSEEGPGSLSVRDNMLPVLIFRMRSEAESFESEVMKALAPELEAKFVYSVYHSYTFDQLASHPAVVTLPYSVMSYRTTELYALAIPMFVPSPKFFLSFVDPVTGSHGLGIDRSALSIRFCGWGVDNEESGTRKTIPLDLRDARNRSQDCERQLRSAEESLRDPPETSSSLHPYSPNVELKDDPESEMYWLQLADFYDWPHIQYFDSYQHLKALLLTSDLGRIRRSMLAELRHRKYQAVRGWCRALDKVRRASSLSE